MEQYEMHSILKSIETCIIGQRNINEYITLLLSIIGKTSGELCRQ